ncbi:MULTISPECIES: outer membrane protein [Meridianimarinicoccus]|uniref:outer membrane protein n=1 Tax=Meridianimarinicoccus zhengii TaxID=2056810 RepID=UPI000DAD2976|nr:outer membrane beta-barrel protein [Phycocomes zhengii]
MFLSRPRPAGSVACLAAVFALAALPAAAEFELSLYSGWQTAPHSDVSGNDPGGVGSFDFTAGWDGNSFDAPIHYGFRGTWWRGGGDLGFGLELNHTKVYADDETLADEGFERLEFTDGLNIITANVMRRFSGQRRWTPYLGGGLGLAYPHVDVKTTGGKTFGYQVTGPAVAWMAGVTYDLSESWSVFGEYKGTYSQNEADLDNGGTLETDIVTNAVNLGVSFNF